MFTTAGKWYAVAFVSWFKPICSSIEGACR